MATKKLYKITIAGNSVALRNRPAENPPRNLNYGSVLEILLNDNHENEFFMVTNLGFSRATIKEIFWKAEKIVTTFPDFIVLNIGVVDASTRDIPLWMSNMINSSNQGLLHQFIRGINHVFVKSNRAFWVKLRGKKTWTSKKKFKSYYLRILNRIEKDTNAQIILITINGGNERIERQLPGSMKNYRDYNEIIKQIAKEKNLSIVSTEGMNSSDHFPDGIHFNSKGHEMIAERIQKIIEKKLENAN